VDAEVEQLIETWRGPLTGLLAGWGAGWSEAAELAQDALVEAWIGRERLRGELTDASAAGPWLRGIARNLWRGRQRERQREQPAASAPALDPAGAGAARAGSAGEERRLERLRDELARLPDKLRVVLYMHYLEETSVREVAGLLAVTPKVVESRLYQARRELRRRLEGSAASGKLPREQR
jgi:RNA polymerase sigma-70 factor (ECF subfamily)